MPERSTTSGTPSSRRIACSLLVGVLHAAGLLAVALDLGYAVSPAEYTTVGLLWRYGGLVAVAALPVWLALRFRLLVPLLALVVATGYVLGMELTPPGPTFRDVADLERLEEPTGIIVVENGLYIVRYMVNASVWLVGFLFAGLVEAVNRKNCHRLPAAPDLPDWTTTPASRRQAVSVATVGGLLHLVVMVWFAQRLGVSITGGYGWVLYAASVLGMWVLAAVPLYVLVRHRLVVPAALLTGFIFLDVRAEFTASVDDAHALYFGAWFLSLAVFLVGGLGEYALRRFDLIGRIA